MNGILRAKTALACLAVAVTLPTVAGTMARGQGQGQAQQGGTQAASGSASQPQRPTFRTATNFVSVDAYPTAGGKPVTDLSAADFEVLENGVPQKVETFQRIVARAPGAEAERIDPRSIAESDQAAADPRNRLFVLFLDSYHVGVDSTSSTFGSSGGQGALSLNTVDRSSASDSRFGFALAKTLDRLIGPEDLIGVTRPEMPMSALSFTRRPSSFEDFLLRGGLWERRFVGADLDDVERQYQSCYADEREAVAAMIARRRERAVLDALRNLVIHLGDLREGRKAVLVVSDGWQLFRPDSTLAVLKNGAAPGPPPIGILNGQPVVGDARVGGSMVSCDRDRRMLAAIDDERDFRAMLDEANRVNVTFYPIDPRGLTAFDSLAPTDIIADQHNLHVRQESLETLASATDGIATVNSTDFGKSLQRIADDLSTYYLLGYYSTNSKSDGSFRTITVHVKRPGVTVRARRGYRALTAREAAEHDAALANPALTAAPSPTATALSALSVVRTDTPVRARVGYLWPAAGAAAAGASIWVVGELDPAATRAPDWPAAGEVAALVTLAGADDRPAGSAEGRLSAAARTFKLELPADGALAAGDYTVRIAWHGPALNMTDSFRVTIPARDPHQDPLLGQPLLFRRGPFTSITYQPTADPRFRRQERVRLDVPVVGSVGRVEASLLDHAGHTLAVPVTAGQRDDAGARVVTAELVLAPLAPGDYIIQVSVANGDVEQKTLVGIRIVP